MIRTRKIIGKDQIFDYVGDEKVAKVEINTSKQKTLKNDKVCSVYIYHRVEWNLVSTIIGKCKKAQLQDLGGNDSYKALVTGIGSACNDGFISACNINKLVQIQDKTGYDFSISKNIVKLCQGKD